MPQPLYIRIERLYAVGFGVRARFTASHTTGTAKSALFSRHGLADNGFTLVMITRLSKGKNIIEILCYMPALYESACAAWKAGNTAAETP